mgnify:FL=1
MLHKYHYIFGIIVGIIFFPVFIFMTYSLYVLYLLRNSLWFASGEANPFIPLYLIVSFLFGIILPIMCFKRLRNNS